MHSVSSSSYSAVAVLLAHKQFIDFNEKQWHSLLNSRYVYDLKGIVPDKYLPVRP